jgi:hypothetical protein
MELLDNYPRRYSCLSSQSCVRQTGPEPFPKVKLVSDRIPYTQTFNRDAKHKEFVTTMVN